MVVELALGTCSSSWACGVRILNTKKIFCRYQITDIRPVQQAYSLKAAAGTSDFSASQSPLLLLMEHRINSWTEQSFNPSLNATKQKSRCFFLVRQWYYGGRTCTKSGLKLEQLYKRLRD